MNDQPHRDLAGYAGNSPDPQWPGGANIVINFVMNFEEGAEFSLIEGDNHAEAALSDLAPTPYLQGQRFLNIESLYEYGSRVGFWRILRHFREHELSLTFNTVGRALELNPGICVAIARTVSDGLADVQSHGWRWIDYANISEDEEREHMGLCIDIIKRVTGERPLGWYIGRPSANTCRLVAEEGGFLYDSDAYNDDLPYWTTDFGQPHLIVPYGLDTNDSRCARNQGFDHADDFFIYMRDAFDALYAEGAAGHPSMMSVGMHCRLIGKPARIAGLTKFLDYVMTHDKVWIATHPYGK